MKIISVKHHAGSSDFGFAILNDEDARAFYAKCERANSENLFSLEMFSPDTSVDLLAYIKSENAQAKTDRENDK